MVKCLFHPSNFSKSQLCFGLDPEYTFTFHFQHPQSLFHCQNAIQVVALFLQWTFELPSMLSWNSENWQLQYKLLLYLGMWTIHISKIVFHNLKGWNWANFSYNFWLRSPTWMLSLKVIAFSSCDLSLMSYGLQFTIVAIHLNTCYFWKLVLINFKLVKKCLFLNVENCTIKLIINTNYDVFFIFNN